MQQMLKDYPIATIIFVMVAILTGSIISLIERTVGTEHEIAFV